VTWSHSQPKSSGIGVTHSLGLDTCESSPLARLALRDRVDRPTLRVRGAPRSTAVSRSIAFQRGRTHPPSRVCGKLTRFCDNTVYKVRPLCVRPACPRKEGLCCFAPFLLGSPPPYLRRDVAPDQARSVDPLHGARTASDHRQNLVLRGKDLTCHRASAKSVQRVTRRRFVG
jgi:hypothetical protein